MKRRLDILLVERGLAESRTRAQALVMEGKVRVAGQTEYKPSRQVDDETPVEIESPPRFVSRGGEKLEGAFELWGAAVGACLRRARGRLGGSRPLWGFATHREANTPSEASAEASLPDDRGLPGVLSAEGKTCLDVGSSTGGFTDCLLQHGARRVMSVDVGTNQLAYKLRTDSRVWVRENFNARYMKPEDLPEVPALAVTDVSFISLKLILPPICGVLAPGGEIVALIKPQFEVGKGNAPGGLVRDESLRLAARDEIIRFAKEELGLELLGLAESPIKGREMGNVEYLSWWRKPIS